MDLDGKQDVGHEVNEPAAFSKASLYASLQTYEQHGGPSKTTKLPSQAKAVESLGEFIREVSANYHATCGPSARDAAGRAISAAVAKENVAQKALVLVTGFSNTMPSDVCQKTTRKRRRRTNSEAGKWKPFIVNDFLFLDALNSRWNTYIKKLIGAEDPASIAELAPGRLEEVSEVEWVGSRVRIESCSSHPCWKDRRGIMVENRPHVWVIASTEREKPWKRRTPSSKRSPHALVVPKKGTVLVATLPLVAKNDSAGADEKELCMEVR